MTFYVIYFRRGAGPWALAELEAPPNSYESYPRLYPNDWRANEQAVQFKTEAGGDCETRVVPVQLTPPT